jgi:hypothetical protein
LVKVLQQRAYTLRVLLIHELPRRCLLGNSYPTICIIPGPMTPENL